MTDSKSEMTVMMHSDPYTLHLCAYWPMTFQPCCATVWYLFTV